MVEFFLRLGLNMGPGLKQRHRILDKNEVQYCGKKKGVILSTEY